MASVHFTDEEFACQCGCGMQIINTRLVGVLEFIRARFMRPVHILSGNRCPSHNVECGGVDSSQHLLGTAADIYIAGIPLDSIVTAAEQAGATGIGVYKIQNFVHVDVRPEVARWEG